MKRIILIFVVLLVLAGIGAGASIYLKIGPLPAMLGMQTEAKKEQPPPPPPRHAEVVVGSFVIPVIQEHGISRSVGLDVALDVLSDDQPKVEAIMPRLQNGFLLALYEVIPVHSDVHSSADKKAIHDRLMLVAERLTGKGVIQDVVIKSIYER